MEYILENKQAMYYGIQFGLWILWDFVPLVSILIIHYHNFNSFKDDDDVLFTEYTADDPRGTHYGTIVFNNSDELQVRESKKINNPLETSLNNIEVTSELDSTTYNEDDRTVQ